ncbi:redoxin domain-containing protein [Luteimonas deserti]|uniref:Redoxin domain-containing protein n=1 Tax=Luteimonas deserti TaxID=2752306 RepID=A0A7Z0QPE8_9GAMM|nr:redoxin domain-containing protein [Luteimonas deserti]NYZ61546.1 redoxin domain-containing protein [Luteimonas deserti]
MDIQPTHLARPAPELEVAAWLNVAGPLSIAGLRGRIVLLHAFQMLCPGCVSHGIPQAASVHARFSARGVVTIGLHTVFEHHAVMGPEALAAFVGEYRLGMPVAVDRPSTEGPVPQTMTRYGFRGTPSLALIDHLGRLRSTAFGRVDDLTLGAALGQLVLERDQAAGGEAAGCTPFGCALPEQLP